MKVDFAYSKSQRTKNITQMLFGMDSQDMPDTVISNSIKRSKRQCLVILDTINLKLISYCFYVAYASLVYVVHNT